MAEHADADAGVARANAELVAQLERLLDRSRAQQRHLRTSILRVLDYLEHPSTR